MVSNIGPITYKRAQQLANPLHVHPPYRPSTSGASSLRNIDELRALDLRNSSGRPNSSGSSLRPYSASAPGDISQSSSRPVSHARSVSSSASTTVANQSAPFLDVPVARSEFLLRSKGQSCRTFARPIPRIPPKLAQRASTKHLRPSSLNEAVQLGSSEHRGSMKDPCFVPQHINKSNEKED
jgi:hypothetical protein